MRRARRPYLSPASLVIDGEVAVLTVERSLLSPNRSLWAHWRVKHRERRAWETSIRGALLAWLDAVGRTRGARAELVALHAGQPAPAPEGRYRVDVTRFVPSRAHLITDEDNLVFCVKPALDALVSLGYIYSDRQDWLTRPVPRQIVRPGPAATEFRIRPWWRGPGGRG